MCLATSVSVNDIITFEVRYTDRTGENYLCRWQKNHKWVYFPEMKRDEVMLLKCWDSRGADFIEDAGKPIPPQAQVPGTFSFHSAFEDPTSPLQAPERESMEVRTIAFWDDDDKEMGCSASNL